MDKRAGRRLAVAALLCFVSLAYANDSTALLGAADRALAEHRYNEARSLYERAMSQGAELENDSSRARNMATAYLRGTPPDPVQGIRWLRLVLAKDPQADATRLELAQALRRQSDLPAAIASYRVLVETHPQSAEYVIGLAATLRDAGQSEDAIQLLRTTLKYNSTSLRLRLELGRLLNFSRQFVEAKQQFRAILAADPHNLFAELGLAKASSFAGDQEGALEIYDQILQRHPGWYDAQVGKAFALLWSGHKEAAYDLLRKAQQRHPEDEEVRAALAGHAGTGDQLEQRPGRLAKVRGAAATRRPAASSALKSPALLATRAIAPVPAADSDNSHLVIPSTFATWLKYLGGGFVLLTLAGLTLKLASRLAARRSNVSLTSVTMSSEPDITLLTPTASSSSSSSVDAQTTIPSEQAGEAISALDRLARELWPNPEIADPQMKATDSKGEPKANPEQETPAQEIQTSSRRQVLLVGGSSDLLEFERAWLAARDTDTRVEGSWLPALARLLNTPPDLLILNGTTCDGWSSAQMFAWLAAQSGVWAGRTLIIVGRREATRLLTHNGHNVEILIEPFTGQKWEQVAEILLSEDSRQGASSDRTVQ